MSFSHWITVAAVAFLPLAVTAQQANPADANAAVAETSYVSAFKNYAATPEEIASPDQVWRAANEEVGGSDPHAGHGGHGAMARVPTQPAAQEAGSAQVDLHAGQGMHMTAPAPAKADAPAGHAGHNH
jgi:hypothetical protein